MASQSDAKNRDRGRRGWAGHAGRDGSHGSSPPHLPPPSIPPPVSLPIRPAVAKTEPIRPAPPTTPLYVGSSDASIADIDAYGYIGAPNVSGNPNIIFEMPLQRAQGPSMLKIVVVSDLFYSLKYLESLFVDG